MFIFCWNITFNTYLQWLNHESDSLKCLYSPYYFLLPFTKVGTHTIISYFNSREVLTISANKAINCPIKRANRSHQGKFRDRSLFAFYWELRVPRSYREMRCVGLLIIRRNCSCPRHDKFHHQTTAEAH